MSSATSLTGKLGVIACLIFLDPVAAFGQLRPPLRAPAVVRPAVPLRPPFQAQTFFPRPFANNAFFPNRPAVATTFPSLSGVGQPLFAGPQGAFINPYLRLNQANASTFPSVNGIGQPQIAGIQGLFYNQALPYTSGAFGPFVPPFAPVSPFTPYAPAYGPYSYGSPYGPSTPFVNPYTGFPY